VPVAVVTRMRAKAGAAGQLERAIRVLIARARGEGTADAPRYTLYRHSEDPAVLVLWEYYAGDCAPDIVGNGAQTANLDELEGLIDGRPILETFIEVDGD
jgi:hypothetical protein